MAITILNKPTTPNVTETKLVYSISSSNALQPQFNYVTDIYPSGSSTLLTRLFTYPNLTGNGIVDIAKVLDDSLSYESNFLYSGSSYLDLYGKFDIKFGEAYGSSISGSVTIYDDLTSDYIEVFTGTIDPNSGNFNFPSSSYIPTTANYTTANVNLSKLPLVGTTTVQQPVEEDQYLTLNLLKSSTWILNHLGSPSNYYEIIVFYSDTTFDVWQIYTNTGTVASETGILNIGIGPANLKQYTTTSVFNADTFTQAFAKDWVLVLFSARCTIQSVLNASLLSYTYYNPNASYADLRYWSSYTTVESRFNQFTYCNTSTRFAFINENGTWDYYNVYAPLRRDTDVNRNIYEQNYVDYSSNTSIYSYEKRGEKQYLTGYTDRFNITTPYLKKTEADYITNLLDSPEVFVQEGNNFIPIVITNSDYTWNMDENRQKLFQYTIEYRYANQRYDR